jgi:hypothetical protein
MFGHQTDPANVGGEFIVMKAAGIPALKHNNITNKWSDCNLGASWIKRR